MRWEELQLKRLAQKFLAQHLFQSLSSLLRPAGCFLLVLNDVWEYAWSKSPTPFFLPTSYSSVFLPVFAFIPLPSPRVFPIHTALSKAVHCTAFRLFSVGRWYFILFHHDLAARRLSLTSKVVFDFYLFIVCSLHRSTQNKIRDTKIDLAFIHECVCVCVCGQNVTLFRCVVTLTSSPLLPLTQCADSRH